MIKDFIIDNNGEDDKVKAALAFLKEKGFQILKFLGKGSFGLVMLARKSDSPEQLAIKYEQKKNE